MIYKATAEKTPLIQRAITDNPDRPDEELSAEFGVSTTFVKVIRMRTNQGQLFVSAPDVLNPLSPFSQTLPDYLTARWDALSELTRNGIMRQNSASYKSILQDWTIDYWRTRSEHFESLVRP